MDITKYNFYFVPDNLIMCATTIRHLKTDTNFTKLEAWGNDNIDPEGWASDGWRKFPKDDWEEEPRMKNKIKIKPILFHCHECNNKGCTNCRSYYFSVWNKFNGYN